MKMGVILTNITFSLQNFVFISQHFTLHNINASQNTSSSSIFVHWSLELEKDENELQRSNFLQHSPIRCCLDTWTGLYRLLLSDSSLLVRRNVRFTANNWQEFRIQGTCSLVAGTKELAMSVIIDFRFYPLLKYIIQLMCSVL